MMRKRRNRRKCEICGIREAHLPDDSIHFAVFPRDENRCREWLRIVGNEELLYLPIEKLRQLKCVCSLHFKSRDFNRLRNRLKKHAVPSLNLPIKPLTDSQLAKFPLKIRKTPDVPAAECPESLDPIYEDYVEEISDDDVEQTLYEPPVAAPETAEAAKLKLAEASGVEKVDPHRSVHTGYLCNLCQGDIVGFRYACVECTDFDLCGACEAGGEHAAHYVLRVPANKHHVEVQAILENIRNVLKGSDDHSSEPEVKLEDPEQCMDVKLDPLAPLDDCQHDVSEIQLPTRKQSSLSQTYEKKQSTIEDAVTISIQTETVGGHPQLTLYAQLNTGPEETQKASHSRLETWPSIEETQKASHSRLETWLSKKETQKASHSRLETWPSIEETQKASHSRLETWLNKEETQKASHSRLETWLSKEETQKASHSRLETWLSKGETQKASHSRLETCERLRVTAGPTKRAAGSQEGSAGDRFSVSTHREPPDGTSQGITAREEAKELTPEATKRKPRVKLLLHLSKIRKLNLAT